MPAAVSESDGTRGECPATARRRRWHSLPLRYPSAGIGERPENTSGRTRSLTLGQHGANGMTDLVQAWLMDPLALLFLLSVALGVYLIARRTARHRNASHRRRSVAIGWILLLVWVTVFLVSSAPVVVNPLIAVFEDPWIETTECEPGSHLILLGGGVDSRVQSVDEFGRMSGATLTRATEAARWLRERPDTRIVVAGGAIGDIAEADVMSAYLQRMGVSADRIIPEAESGSTRENALHVLTLLEQQSVSGAVGLVTSAMHMPRAILSFRHAFSEFGSDVSLCPMSVDIQALRDVPWYALMPQTTAIVRFERLLHEAVALLVYRLKGWL